MSYQEVLSVQQTNEMLIFIVEDSKMYAMMLEHQLQKATNHKYKRYLTGQECLDDLHLNPEVIILDYNLPKMDGLEILQKIKKHNSRIHVIVLSAQQDLKIAINMFKEGASDYIIKGTDSAAKLNQAINKLPKKLIRN